MNTNAAGIISFGDERIEDQRLEQNQETQTSRKEKKK